MLIQDHKVLYEQNTQIKAIFNKGIMVWPKTVPNTPVVGSNYFYVENILLTPETVIIKKNNSSAPTLTIEYCTSDPSNENNWSVKGTTSTSDLTFSLNGGDKVYLRCKTNQWSNNESYYNTIKGCSKVGGNIMSLFYGDEFTGNETTFPSLSSDEINYRCARMFYYNTDLINAGDLILPCTYFYYDGLTYEAMFCACSNLTSAPQIATPTSTGTNTYNSMFVYCDSLTTAPDLNFVGTIDNLAYAGMFDGCDNLNYVKCLGTTHDYSSDQSGYWSTLNWLRNVSSTGTFVKKAGVTWPTGDSGIPSGWTVEEV